MYGNYGGGYTSSLPSGGGGYGVSDNKKNDNTIQGQTQFYGNDYRGNFDIKKVNNVNPTHGFKDTFSSPAYNNYQPTPSYASSSRPTNPLAPSNVQAPSFSSYQPTSYQPSSCQPAQSSYEPKQGSGVGMFGQVSQGQQHYPAAQIQQPAKPLPLNESNNTKQVSNIIKKNQDLDNDKLQDQANMAKVIYSSAMSASTTSAKFKEVFADCQKNRKNFEDKDFSRAAKTSIAPPDYQSDYRDVKDWKRPKDIWQGKQPQLYLGKVEPNDIVQGQLGDCYLLSTLAAIAENDQRIKRLFSTESYNQEGVYSVTICWRGVHQEVLVDDFIPTDAKGQPYFLSSRGEEIWVILLEKAWAKLHKSYHQIDGQLTKEALHDFTGAPVRSYTTTKDQKILWEKVIEAEKQNYIMTCGTYGEDDGDSANDPKQQFGLVSGHAYSLIGAYNLSLGGQQHQILRVRNPWGDSTEWNGKWRDNDPDWKNVPQSEKDKMGYKQEEDGTFFIDYASLIKHFDGVQICYINDQYSYQGIKCKSSYNQSKFFELKLNASGPQYFNVSQFSIRCFDPDDVNPATFYSETKFCVADSNGKIIQAFQGKKRDLYSPKYIDKPENFQAGTYYVWVQVKWQKSATHSFGLGAYGPGDSEFKNIDGGASKGLAAKVQQWESASFQSIPNLGVDVENIVNI